MAYTAIRAKALAFLRQHGLDDPTAFKMSDIAMGCGAIVRHQPLSSADGRIVFSKRNAIISVNSNISLNERKRFILAHELGHFAMHREHFELHSDTQATLDYFQKGPQEREANEFAAELLMPYQQFRQASHGATMGPELIRSIATQFQVTLTAAAFRFLELGDHPVMIVYSEDGKVKYYKASDKFEPRLRDIVRLSVPIGSVAHEFFYNKTRYTVKEGRQEIRRSTWFEMGDFEVTDCFFEYCIPNSWNNSAISVIWQD